MLDLNLDSHVRRWAIDGLPDSAPQGEWLKSVESEDRIRFLQIQQISQDDFGNEAALDRSEIENFIGSHNLWRKLGTQQEPFFQRQVCVASDGYRVINGMIPAPPKGCDLQDLLIDEKEFELYDIFRTLHSESIA